MADYWIRVSRWWVIPFFGGITAFGLWLIPGTFSMPGSTLENRMVVVLWPAIGAVLLVHYLWFYYVRITDAAICQVKYFGLSRRCVPLDELTKVCAESAIARGKPSYEIRFCWRGGRISLIGPFYGHGQLRAPVTYLRERGVPVEPQVLHLLGLEPAGR